MVVLNKMQGRGYKIFNLACISGVAFCFALMWLGAGCSKYFITKKPVPDKRWSCDKEADEAMLRKDYEASIRLHQWFLEKEPVNGLALYHLGYAYGQLGDHLKEVSYYEKAIALGFETGHIFFNLGMAYGELNQPEKSIRAFKKALIIDPGNLDARLNLSLLYAEIGELHKARQQLQKILEIDPTYAPARQFLESLERE